MSTELIPGGGALAWPKRPKQVQRDQTGRKRKKPPLVTTSPILAIPSSPMWKPRKTVETYLLWVVGKLAAGYIVRLPGLGDLRGVWDDAGSFTFILNPGSTLRELIGRHNFPEHGAFEAFVRSAYKELIK